MDIVGEAGKALFGEATQRDMTDICRAVKAVARDTGIVFHRTEKMMTIINQTQKYVRENREGIQQLQQHQQALQTQLFQSGANLSQLALQVDRLTVARLVDNLITQLELVAKQYSRQ